VLLAEFRQLAPDLAFFLVCEAPASGTHAQILAQWAGSLEEGHAWPQIRI
jgi:hypothetical protein